MEFVLTPTWRAAAYWLLTAAWVGEFLVFRSRDYGERRRNPASFRLLVVAVLLSWGASGLLYHFGATRLSGRTATVIRDAGLLAYAGGILLRYWSAWTLGPWFSRHVQASKEQYLVSRGPYRVLRHPLYAGLFAIVTGMTMMMVTVAGVAFGSLATAWALNRRMVEEERLMESTIEGYSRWKESRYRFLPPFF